MILLQAAASPGGPANTVLGLVDAGNLELVLSPKIVAELRDVLSRPSVRRRFPVLDSGYVEAFLTGLVANSTWIDDPPSTIRIARDPKDEPYVNLAMCAKAEYLVTRDRDLLELARTQLEPHRDLQIVTPVMLLEKLRMKQP